jgi:hypothetical protein
LAGGALFRGSFRPQSLYGDDLHAFDACSSNSSQLTLFERLKRYVWRV